ncbi:MAG TPA: hypothetical protein VL053_19600 [Arachidicoccus sp.]|nr:hypothetical protein [Arachidicoccus sp.]
MLQYLKLNRLPAILIVLVLLGFVVGCKNAPKEEANEKSKESLPAKSGQKHCYAYLQNRDTIILTIQTTDSARFQGSMIYKLYEKDQNIGTVEGIRKGDLLVADYTFNSEGKASIRQVAFKQQGQNLTEGFGAVIEDKEDGAVRFSNLDSLSFDSQIILQQTPCL